LVRTPIICMHVHIIACMHGRGRTYTRAHTHTHGRAKMYHIPLLITANTDDNVYANVSLQYENISQLNDVFGCWDSHNTTLGYRTTADYWLDDINCTTDILKQCYDRNRSGKCLLLRLKVRYIKHIL